MINNTDNKADNDEGKNKYIYKGNMLHPTDMPSIRQKDDDEVTHSRIKTEKTTKKTHGHNKWTFFY